MSVPGDTPDAARLLDQLADEDDQFLASSVVDAELAQVCEGLQAVIIDYLRARLPATKAVLRRELLDPERVLRAALAAWARAFADELERDPDAGAT